MEIYSNNIKAQKLLHDVAATKELLSGKKTVDEVKKFGKTFVVKQTLLKIQLWCNT